MRISDWSSDVCSSDLNLAAQIRISPIEIEPGRRVRIRGARLVTDAVQGIVTIDARARAGDPEALRRSGSIRDNGRVPLRANGRHIGITAQIPAGAVWTYVNGVELEYETEGSRCACFSPLPEPQRPNGCPRRTGHLKG